MPKRTEIALPVPTKAFLQVSPNPAMLFATFILVVWQLRVSIPIWILECICHVYVLASKDRISAHEVLMGMEMDLRVEMGQVQLHLYHDRQSYIHFIMLFDHLRTKVNEPTDLAGHVKRSRLIS